MDLEHPFEYVLQALDEDLQNCQKILEDLEWKMKDDFNRIDKKLRESSSSLRHINQQIAECSTELREIIDQYKRSSADTNPGLRVSLSESPQLARKSSAQKFCFGIHRTAEALVSPFVCVVLLFLGLSGWLDSNSLPQRVVSMVAGFLGGYILIDILFRRIGRFDGRVRSLWRFSKPASPQAAHKG